MSTELMHETNSNGEVFLTRVGLPHGGVGYHIFLKSKDNKVETWQVGCESRAGVTVDAETIRNMLRCVDESEREMKNREINLKIAELEREILKLRAKLVRPKPE